MLVLEWRIVKDFLLLARSSAGQLCNVVQRVTSWHFLLSTKGHTLTNLLEPRRGMLDVRRSIQIQCTFYQYLTKNSHFSLTLLLFKSSVSLSLSLDSLLDSFISGQIFKKSEEPWTPKKPISSNQMYLWGPIESLYLGCSSLIIGTRHLQTIFGHTDHHLFDYVDYLEGEMRIYGLFLPVGAAFFFWPFIMSCFAQMNSPVCSQMWVSTRA